MPNSEHLCIDPSNGPTAWQIKQLNSEILQLQRELDEKD